MSPVVAYVSAALGLAFIILLIWTAVLLASNPVGELTPEFFYLTAADLRAPLFLSLGVLTVEAAELFYPVLGEIGLPPVTPEITAVLNLVQGVLLAFVALQAMLIVVRYTHSGIERRIRDSIDTLAFLQGQRRRRRRS